MGDEYNNSGQAGAFGDNAHSHDNIFNQYHYYNQSAPFTPPALHQLPPPSADFIGRGKEIAELLQALEKRSVVITGLGGIGKTALAYKLAEYLESSYPDAQFYIDLNGVSKQPLSPAKAMTRIIRSIRPDAQLPEDESSLQAIYLSELKGKKALLLLDDAASPEQIKPLLPPATCVLLVTSRFHFTLRDLGSINLDTLEPEDAQQLLLKISPRIGECAGKIAELCGYLPLALEVAASTFRISVSLTPDDYVKRFSDTTKRLKLLDKVSTSLALSYELLDEEMQKHWRVLSVLPNTFDAHTVAALWEMNVEDAKDKLDELISYSLIEWNETTRRYRLHDVVRLFADSRLDEPERFFAKDTQARYFGGLLAYTNELYLKGNEDLIRGLALFDIERENIEAGQAWFASFIGKDDAVTQLSLDYNFVGLSVISLRLPSREMIIWLESSLQAARILKDRDKEGATLCNLASIYLVWGESRKAIQVGKQSLEIVREIGDQLGEGKALCHLGSAHIALGESRKGIEFCEQSLEIVRKIGDQLQEVITLGNLGTAYIHLGEYCKAIEFYEQSLDLTRKIGNLSDEVIMLGNLGAAYIHLGEYYKAVEVCEKALAIAREIDDLRGGSNALGNLGIAYWKLGKPSKAIEIYQQQLEIVRGIGDLRGEGNALWNTALAYYELGNRTQAISLAEMGLAIYKQIESPYALEVRSKLSAWKKQNNSTKFGLLKFLKRLFLNITP